jgi:hypothetical protein
MKRRHEVDRQKLEAWSMTFDSGYDFFSELAPLGKTPPAGRYESLCLRK